MRGSGTLAEKQEEMRKRHERMKDLSKHDKLLSNLPEGRSWCISCKHRVARIGTVLCSRCTGEQFQNQYRDTLPGAIVTKQEEKLCGFYWRDVENCENFCVLTEGHPGAHWSKGDGWSDGEIRPKPSLNLSQQPHAEAPPQHPITSGFEPPTPDEPKTYTRSEVAEMLGISCTTICRWEKKGRTPQPKRIMHNNQCIYTEELVGVIREYMDREYIPPTISSPTPNTPEGRIPLAAKKVLKVNKRLERVVATRIGRGRLM